MPEVVQRKSLEPYVKDDIEYYQHQAEGIRRMAKMKSFLLCDEMGLGKTLQALTVFGIDLYRGRSETMLVVCPSSLKQNWAHEIQEFMGDVRYLVVPNKTPAHRSRLIRRFAHADSPKILIMNYEQIKAHLDEINDINFDVVAFDEAHMLKNHEAERTITASKINRTRTFLITGSPILNHVDDLWSLLNLGWGEEEWGSYAGFVNTYCVYGGYKGSQIIATKNEQVLNSRLSDVMIRRLKKNVLDLPDVQYIQRIVGLAPVQKRLYNEIIEDMQLTIADDEDPVQIKNALTKFMRLKQICGTTATVLEDKKDISMKLDAAIFDAVQIVREEGHRLVVFTQFRPVLAAYVDRFKTACGQGALVGKGVLKKSPPIFELHGDVDTDDRQRVVDEWTNSDVPGVIVCMFSVGGVGLNMTAARHGQFLDKLFNPPLNQQAADRMHRIGADKTQPIQILEYLCEDTAEERVEEILRTKKKAADPVLGDDQSVKALIARQIAKEGKIV